jgi:hypothetical protein
MQKWDEFWIAYNNTFTIAIDTIHFQASFINP